MKINQLGDSRYIWYDYQRVRQTNMMKHDEAWWNMMWHPMFGQSHTQVSPISILFILSILSIWLVVNLILGRTHYGQCWDNAETMLRQCWDNAESGFAVSFSGFLTVKTAQKDHGP